MHTDFLFSDEKNTDTISCTHVIKDKKPILYASHDADDGMWQFLCGGEHRTEDAMIVSLYEVYQIDDTISNVADLPLGHVAERKSIHSKWEAHSS